MGVRVDVHGWLQYIESRLGLCTGVPWSKISRDIERLDGILYGEITYQRFRVGNRAPDFEHELKIAQVRFLA